MKGWHPVSIERSARKKSPCFKRWAVYRTVGTATIDCHI